MDDALAQSKDEIKELLLTVLILVVMDDALALGTEQGREAGTGRVLILVVMDDALAPVCCPTKVGLRIVLILVVMDDALAQP